MYFVLYEVLIMCLAQAPQKVLIFKIRMCHDINWFVYCFVSRFFFVKIGKHWFQIFRKFKKSCAILLNYIEENIPFPVYVSLIFKIGLMLFCATVVLNNQNN